MIHRSRPRGRRSWTSRRTRSRRPEADSLPTSRQDLQREEEFEVERTSSPKVSVFAELDFTS